MGVYCDVCETSIPGRLDNFITHIREEKHKPPFVCTEGDCQRRKFQAASSLYRHLRSDHSDICDYSSDSDSSDSGSERSESANSSNSARVQFQLSHGNSSGENSFGESFSDGNESAAEEDPLNIDDFARELERAAALMILNVKKHANVTATAISIVTKECQVMIQQVVKLTKANISRNLKQAQVADNIIDMCLENEKTYEPFRKLMSAEQQLRYFEGNFGLVMPQAKFINFRFENRLDKTSRNVLPKQIKVNFQYISIIETLTVVLNNPVLFQLIHSEKRSSDGKIRSFLDGSLVESNPLINQYPHTIRLVPYTDDFETANAQGAKAIIHAISGLYFMIQNLPPEENARLRSIHVAAFAYRQDLPSERGVDVILEPLLKEIKRLECEEGVVIKVNGEDYTLRATLVAFSADTLAAHEILGLASPSAGHFCSLCHVCRSDFHQDILAMGVPRTKESMSAQVDEIRTRGVKRVQEDYGVQRRSILMQEQLSAKFPDACVLDPMHDILKGIGPMEIKLALHDFIVVKKLFTVEAFNAKLQAFNYGPADMTNKPSPNFTYDTVKNKGHYTMHQSAAQTWCLLRVFPFIAASLNVPQDNEHLKLIVLLKRLCDIVFSLVISDANLNQLTLLIVEHHQLFSTLYSAPAPIANEEVNEGEVDDFLEEDVDGDLDQVDQVHQPNPPQMPPAVRRPKVIRQINKHHHLLHYANLIRKFGPIVQYWCMRFEGKHAFAKRTASICCNFINLPFTFANTHQINHAAELMELTTAVKEEVKYPAGGIMKAADGTGYFDVLQEIGLQGDDVLTQVDHVTVGGFMYETGLHVTLPFHNDGLPVFGYILSIFVHNSSQVYLITEDRKCAMYDLRFGAYLVEESVNPSIRAFEPAQLSHDRPMKLWTADSVSFYLSPRRTLAVL